MSEHTKGPWTLNYGRTVAGLRADGGVQLVGSVFGIVAYGDMRDKEESRANAALICAAPDLLEALKVGADIIGHPDDPMSVYFQQLIARAEGKS